MTVLLGLSGVQSSKYRLLTSLLGKTQLLWTQCRGIEPHLAERGKSHGFSRVTAGTWDIFSSNDGDETSKLVSVHGHEDTCLVLRDTSGISARLERAIRMLLKVRSETLGPSMLTQ